MPTATKKKGVRFADNVQEKEYVPTPRVSSSKHTSGSSPSRKDLRSIILRAAQEAYINSEVLLKEEDEKGKKKEEDTIMSTASMKLAVRIMLQSILTDMVRAMDARESMIEVAMGDAYDPDCLARAQLLAMRTVLKLITATHTVENMSTMVTSRKQQHKSILRIMDGFRKDLVDLFESVYMEKMPKHRSRKATAQST